MKKFRLLACASTLCILTVACGGAPEPAEEAGPAAAPEETPAPAAPESPAATAAGDGGEGAPAGGERPRLVAPVRGVADVGYVKPIVVTANKGGKQFIVSTIEIKNMATGSIAGLKVEEFWYDKSGNVVTGDEYRHPKPLQPGETLKVVLETPNHPAMDRNSYSFSHANGQINAKLQPKL